MGGGIGWSDAEVEVGNEFLRRGAVDVLPRLVGTEQLGGSLKSFMGRSESPSWEVAAAAAASWEILVAWTRGGGRRRQRRRTVDDEAARDLVLTSGGGGVGAGGGAAARVFERRTEVVVMAGCDGEDGLGRVSAAKVEDPDEATARRWMVVAGCDGEDGVSARWTEVEVAHAGGSRLGLHDCKRPWRCGRASTEHGRRPSRRTSAPQRGGQQTSARDGQEQGSMVIMNS